MTGSNVIAQIALDVRHLLRSLRASQLFALIAILTCFRAGRNIRPLPTSGSRSPTIARPAAAAHSFHGIAGTAALCLNGPAASIAQPLGIASTWLKL